MIDNNSGRLGKQLWTDGGGGEPITLYSGYNEIDEARYIAERIKSWTVEGNRHDEAAVLYRSNAQSRVLEEAMLRAQLPYRIYGGQRFFERAEIRNALGYVRLVNQRDADASFERVVNTPPRGMGDRTLNEIRKLARSEQISLWQASKRLVEGGGITARTRNAILGFLSLIEEMDDVTEEADLEALLETIIDKSGLRPYLSLIHI